MALLIAGAAQAQISVRFNIGSTPDWGPQGYSDVRYYYLPDVQAYYDIPSSMFIYYEGNSWVRRSYLPSRYRNYDLYRGYKVVMNDYHGSTPYRYYDQHRRNYSRGYSNGYQRTYGERPTYYHYDNNQVNRGRNDRNSYSREYDDRNYDKRGKEKYNRGNSRNNDYHDGRDGNYGNNGYNRNDRNDRDDRNDKWDNRNNKNKNRDD